MVDNDKELEEIVFDDTFDSDQKRIHYQPSNPTISSLYEFYKDGDLVLAPDFQRNYIWDKKKPAI